MKRRRNALCKISRTFWTIHILHHAGEGAFHGPAMAEELREHGYQVSPGSLSPMLRKMERLGWIRAAKPPLGFWKKHKDYRVTQDGRKVLRVVRSQMRELYCEVVLEPGAR